MARISRKCCESLYYHIMVQGEGKKYIFNVAGGKERYVRYLVETSEKLNIRLIAYCIMGNHAHALVYSENINNLTKLMQIVNTKYGIFYNKINSSCGFVYRDRYRCENIFTQVHLENCIRYIHNNPVKAGICSSQKDYFYSSYNDFINKTGIVTDELLKFIFGSSDNYIDKIKNMDINEKFIDTSNEFGYDSDEEMEKVIDELVFKIGKRINELSEKELADLCVEILKRCHISKCAVSKRLSISRTKLYKILSKYGLQQKG